MNSIELTNNIEKPFVPTYIEKMCPSFQEAAKEIYLDNDTPRIVLLDIDGVLLDHLDKLPAYALLNKSKIEEEKQGYVSALYYKYGDNLMVVTNRDPNINMFLSSKYVVEQAKQSTEDIYKHIGDGKEMKIFDGLFKQFPFFSKKKKEHLVEYISTLIPEGESPVLTMIEDWCIASLNRRTFPMYIANTLSKKYNIRCNVENYVIKNEPGW